LPNCEIMLPEESIICMFLIDAKVTLPLKFSLY